MTRLQRKLEAKRHKRTLASRAKKLLKGQHEAKHGKDTYLSKRERQALSR
jgi:hypothetical protein